MKAMCRSMERMTWDQKVSFFKVKKGKKLTFSVQELQQAIFHEAGLIDVEERVEEEIGNAPHKKSDIDYWLTNVSQMRAL